MAPCNLVTASVIRLARSFSLFSWTNTLARSPSALPIAYINPVRCLTSQVSSPPKHPPNGYMRYVIQQKPLVVRLNPGMKSVDIVKKIAQQWRLLTPEQKQPFQEASLRAREQFKLDLQRYEAQLSPAQLEQQTQEKKKRLAKRKAIRKKKELNSLGKPKRSRSAFNIFMSEHFGEAKGTTTQAKMKSLVDDWKSLFSHQKQVYIQLAEDDKVRYKNEMKSWEEHMVEIGREDLLRDYTKSKVKKKKPEAKKLTQKPKSKVLKTAAGKTTRKTKKSNPAKTVTKSTKKT